MEIRPPFVCNEDKFGGTEYMARGFRDRILPHTPKFNSYFCMVLPGPIPSFDPEFYKDKDLILWMHNPMDQLHELVNTLLKDSIFANRIKFIVAVSEYHKYRLVTDLPHISEDKFVIIPNAIDPIEITLSKFDNVQRPKLIHASQSYRGFNILMQALPMIEEDFELSVFNDFYPDFPHNLGSLVEDNRVIFYGNTPRKTVYKALSEAHIHAYPSIFAETSCLVQMEALSAGLLSVHTNVGALPETSLGYGVMVDYYQLTPELYAEELTKAILKIKDGQHYPVQQIKDIKSIFSWERALANWTVFESII
jgi:glycosyltransferase involved in cell wall biosynthesis